MTDLVLLVVVLGGTAVWAAGGFALARWWFPRVEIIERPLPPVTLIPPQDCTARGHDKHIKGTRMVDGIKHVHLYCANPECGREWLERL